MPAAGPISTVKPVEQTIQARVSPLEVCACVYLTRINESIVMMMMIYVYAVSQCVCVCARARMCVCV